MRTESARRVVSTESAPKAIGPYSQAIQIAAMVFTAGQIGLNPKTGEIVEGGITEQTRQVLTNLQNVLKAGSSDLARVVKTTVYLQDMSDFAAMNAVYGEFFPKDPPARSTVAVASLPKGALVEIDAIALAITAP